MTVAAIIQARMGSTRLPGKVLRPLAGRPMVEHVVRRVQQIPDLDVVVTAIPEGASDDPLAEHLAGLEGLTVFRGPEDDVLARYVGAARAAEADVVVRITADCPLICPSVSHRVLAAFLERRDELDYASNTLERTYPQGLDTEVVARTALESAAAEATERPDREHVTYFLWRQPERFRLYSVTDTEDHSDLRWTVDTAEDFELVERVLGALPDGEHHTADYGRLLDLFAEHPEWRRLNETVRQKQPSET